MELARTKKNIIETALVNTKSDTFFVNPVNTDGFMGKGIALQFKKNFPSHFHGYKEKCDKNELTVGKVWIDKTNKIIALPTKKHWRGKSKVEYIETALEDLITYIDEKKIKKIVMPKIGAGLGGLDFDDEVLPTIKKVLSKTELKVVYSIWKPNTIK